MLPGNKQLNIKETSTPITKGRLVKAMFAAMANTYSHLDPLSLHYDALITLNHTKADS